MPWTLLLVQKQTHVDFYQHNDFSRSTDYRNIICTQIYHHHYYKIPGRPQNRSNNPKNEKPHDFLQISILQNRKTHQNHTICKQMYLIITTKYPVDLKTDLITLKTKNHIIFCKYRFSQNRKSHQNRSKTPCFETLIFHKMPIALLKTDL